MTEAPTYTRTDVEQWLEGIAGGAIDLSANNVGLASATLSLLDSTQPEPEPVPEGYLSAHFSLAEMIYSDTANARGIDNTPDDDVTDELADLCNDTLERIRTQCDNNPITVSSGYRCAELNQAIGGAANSAHLYGCAADIEIPAFGDPLAVCRAIAPMVLEFGIDQLIYESDSAGNYWTHVGRALPGQQPRGQCFTISRGVTCYSPFPG